MGMRSAYYPTQYMRINSAVQTSLRARTQTFSSFPVTPSFRSRLRKWSRGKADPLDQTDWSNEYVLKKAHVMLLQLILY